ncbi:MAG: FtsX-like permease family protein [Cytophagales bacterium]|nr:ABC transporter permease [Bernardetiaceae bacterium]MDW8203755.1 FtsX-like permease family protein [Cytophagales bacterium]
MIRRKNNNTPFTWLVATRLQDNKVGSFSALVARIAMASISIGVAAMLLSFMIFEGFKCEIQTKIFSLVGHIRLTKFDGNASPEGSPLPLQTSFLKKAPQIRGIERIEFYSQKSVLLKTDEEVMGALVKGIHPNADSSFFSKNLVSGRFLHFSDSADHSSDLIVSKKIADKLHLQVGDRLTAYFIQNPPRARRLNVCGIYQTGLEDFDERIILADNRMIQQLNRWGDSLTGGYEIYVRDFNRLNQVAEAVYEAMDYQMQMETVESRYAHFFDWFIMLNRNVTIFMTIILSVAAFNTISILIILMMERTQMIGLLKALGATNRQIRNIFFWKGMRILAKGLLGGNLLGLGLAALQYYFHLIPLNPENYYMQTVPIQWDGLAFITVNIATIAVVGVAMWLPTVLIARITPIAAIRFN